MMWFWIAVLFLAVALICFYFALFYSGVQVKSITVSGNQKVSSGDIRNFVSEKISHKIFGIGSLKINSKSILLVDASRLDKEILARFPEIKNVKTSRKFMQALDIKANERLPFAVFCLTSAAQADSGSCYFIDESGMAYRQYDGTEPDILIVRQSNSSDVSIGKKAVEQNMIDLLSKAKKNLQDKFGIALKSALVTGSIRLNVITSENWKIYFDLAPDSDTDSQIAKMDLLLNGGISDTVRKNLRYINLIPKDRAIICDNPTCGG